MLPESRVTPFGHVFGDIPRRTIDATIDTTYVNDIGVTFCCQDPSGFYQSGRYELIDKDVQMSLPLFGEFFHAEIINIGIPAFFEEIDKPMPCFHDIDRVIAVLGECQEPEKPFIEGNVMTLLHTKGAVADAIAEHVYLLLRTYGTVPPLAGRRNRYSLTFKIGPIESDGIGAFCDFKAG